MENQAYYEDRGATSWESRMYSNTPIRLDNYNIHKPYPEIIEGIENRGSTGWELLMMQKKFSITNRKACRNKSFY